MYPPHTLARIMARNIRRTGTPLGIPASKINRLSFQDGGGVMLFTGLMYQMMPYTAKMVRIMGRLEGRGVEKILVHFSRFFSFSGVDERDERYFSSILWKISDLLRDSDVDFFYDPELDFYSGVLLYEMGDERSFAEHASFVAERLNQQGVRKVITVDPHTAYAVKVLYPRFTGISFEVRSYLELVRLDASRVDEEVAVHDPCYYARHLEMPEVIRSALEKCGVRCLDIRNSGRLTSCCGGPVESVSPRLSMEISRSRYAELKGTGRDVVTACPVCLGSLRCVGEARDVADVLWRVAHG